MSPTPGTRLGPYEIVAPIGAGGMGEVYRAKDTKLNRDVALKILPEAFTSDADRLARFRREAQVLASLNHPNIAAIYGFEDSASTHALVMELVEGEDLSAHIARGAIPLAESLPIAKQIADALEAAHEQGIIHRDLKPANIKVRADGTVKVLDFGLAKAIDPAAAASGNAMNSPTMTAQATQMGMIIGTAAYMSPEQAKGKVVDRRADIWAFGVVLYEMLTGQRLFKGDDITETLASVIKDEPNVSRVPATMQRLLRSCLERDPKQRLQAIGDWRLLLDEPTAPVAAATEGARRWAWPAVAGVATLALAVLAFAHFREHPVEQPLVRLDVELGSELSLPQATGLLLTAGSSIAISPNGMRLVYPSGTPPKLLTRRLDQRDATELAGTQGASDPFFSPDGQWIGFQAGGKLNKVSVEGGAVVPLVEVGSLASAAWSEDDVILLGGTKGIARIPASGGPPETLVAPGNGELLLFPQMLPGGTAVLFSAYTSTTVAPSIDVMTLADRHRKTVSRGGTSPRYLAASDGTGDLVYTNKTTLFAVPFDLAALETRGTAVPIVDDVASFGLIGAAQLSFSRTGTLVYRRAGANGSGEPSQTLHFLEASGQPQPLPGLEPAIYRRLRLAPDGRRLAEIIPSEDQVNLWIRDLQADRTSRLTSKGSADSPAWTPDGGHIAYALSTPATTGGIYWMRADGAGEPALLLEKSAAHPDAFSPDGKWLVYHQHGVNSGTTMWRLPVDATDPDRPKAGPPQAFLQESTNQEYAAFSPDGRWIAYKARDAGREDVFVRPSSGAVVKFLVSSAVGGTHPVWSRNGHELFYLGSDGRIQVVDYTVQGDSFAAGKSRPWSSVQLALTASTFDLMPDGKRMLMALKYDPPESGRSKTTVTMLLNFFDELRRKVPAIK